MEYRKRSSERGIALLGALVLLVTVVAIVTVPLLQLAGWAKREQLRRMATEGRLEARLNALRDRSRPSTPQLFSASGFAIRHEHRYGMEILVAVLRSTLEQHPPRPSWRAIGRGTLLPCRGGDTEERDRNGPRVACSYTDARLQLTDPHTLLAANIIRKGELTIQSGRNGSITVLGAVHVDDALEVDAPGLAVELVAVGEVEVARFVVNAKSLLVRSLFGQIRSGGVDPLGCSPAIRLEAEGGIEIRGETRGSEWGCAVERAPGLWPEYEFVGERAIAAE